MDVSRAVIVAVPWSQQGVTTVIAKIVCASWTRFVAAQCGTQPVRQKPSLVAATVAIVPMDWATAQEIVAVRTVLLAVLLGPANCVCASTTHSAVKRCGMPIVSHGLPKSALEIVDVTQLVPKKAVRKGLSRSREVVALKQKRRAV